MTARTMHKQHPILGITLLVISTFFFAAQDGITKHLTESLSVMQIAGIRFFFFALFALAFAARRVGVRAAFRTDHPWLQIMRGLLIVSEIMLFAFAIRFLGLAEMHALFACFPLVVTALSAPMLGEHIGWRRWLAVSLGFVGTLIILRPGFGVFNPYALLGVVAAVMFAVYNILTRKAGRYDSLETSLVYFGVVGFFGAAILMVFNWQPLTHEQMMWLGVISATAILSHLLLIKALQIAPAVVLQPFNYCVLVWAIGFGWLIWGEVLDLMSLIGAGIVVASGVFIARREYKLLNKNAD